MARNRFVSLNVDRIQLSDGDWIEVKQDLNTGDQKKLEAAGFKPPIMIDGKIITPIDWEVYELHRAVIFLTDWSFRNADDKSVPLNLDSLNALEPESFKEINDAIVKHTLDRVKEKNAQRMANEPSNSKQTL